MKKIVFSLFLLFAVTVSQINLYATTKDDVNWNVVYNDSENVFRNLFFINENVGYVVGNGGIIMKTVDGGTNWTVQNSGVSVILNDVYFVNSSVGYVVGNKTDDSDEIVLKTVDGGNTWTRLTLDDALDRRNFYGVWFTDENNGVIVGLGGTIVRTTDGGNTWARQTVAGGNSLWDVTFVNSATGFASGDNGRIIKTTDGGITWHDKNSGNTGVQFIQFYGENVGYAAGLGGFIKKTVDGGETWDYAYTYGNPFDGYFDFRALSVIGENEVYVSGYDDSGQPFFAKTADGGATWTFVENSIPLNTPLFAMVFPTSNVGYAVSNYDILKSGTSVTNGGTINGRVTNALDGTAIPGALVEIAGLSATTDANGNYEITNIPEAVLTAAFYASPLSGDAPLEVSFTDQSSDAAYTLVVSKEGFSTYTNSQVVIESGETLTMDVSLSPNLGEGEFRIVLNWGDDPDDLDSYLKTPNIEGSEYTVYYGEHGSQTSPPYATLDHDDRDGYGPETITIYQSFAGTYKYYVHNYSGTPAITTSNAVVQVYDNNGLLASVNIPTQGEGDFWNVLTIDGGTGAITVINEITDAAPEKSFKFHTKKNNRKNIVFTKSGSKTITNWHWDFGDGSASTEQNPTHTYSTPGTYTVTLTVSNGTDTDTETKTNYIVVNGSGDIILEQNFDDDTFPPNGWTQNVTNASYTWMHGNPQENSFSEIDPANVYSALCPWVAADQNEWLISPAFSLPNEAITLTFYAGYSTQWLNAATMKVLISVDGGTNWSQIWEAQNDGESWQWRFVELDLSSYNNHSNVKLAWQYVGNDGDLVGIDNILLYYGTVGIDDDGENEPYKFELSQNYPNPFNPTTTIKYIIPSVIARERSDRSNLSDSQQNQQIAANVRLIVYNILGEKIATLVNEKQSPGNYRVQFDASNLPSGVYFYTLRYGNFIATKKMILLK